MHNESFSLHISPTIGEVTAQYIVPDEALAITTLAHGAGAGMSHSFMTALANSLAEVGIATLRFNFPFTESKKKRVDVPAVAHKTIDAAIHHAHAAFPALPLFVSGKSFGGRMCSQWIAIQPLTFIKGVIFYGFPLHPAGKPSIDRAEHLKDISVPMLFLQGTRDELATLNLVEQVCNKLTLATLVKIEGADHAFKAGKQDIITMLSNHTVEWIESVMQVN